MLNTFEQELPFFNTELSDFYETFLNPSLSDFIDKTSFTIDEIKEKYLNTGAWTKQLNDRDSSLSKLMRSEFFVDEAEESAQHRVCFQKLIIFGILSCKCEKIDERYGVFIKLIQKFQEVPLKKKA